MHEVGSWVQDAFPGARSGSGRSLAADRGRAGSLYDLWWPLATHTHSDADGGVRSYRLRTRPHRRRCAPAPHPMGSLSEVRRWSTPLDHLAGEGPLHAPIIKDAPTRRGRGSRPEVCQPHVKTRTLMPPAGDPARSGNRRGRRCPQPDCRHPGEDPASRTGLGHGRKRALTDARSRRSAQPGDQPSPGR